MEERRKGPPNRENYAVKMEREMARLTAEGRVPRLLLHACCAPCSSAVLETLCRQFAVTLFFYNPNILPKEEFDLRAAELARLLQEMPLPRPVELIVPEWDAADYLALARGRENDPEGGERCRACYRLRMEETARAAADGGYEYFCTTLSVSRRKNADWINAIGRELEALYGVRWLVSDFKRRDGEVRSCELSRQYGLYRQDFCGCPYSAAERDRRAKSEG
jgi:predicted adenine nucleotide alpha hydrolase (AANH) superfamily ATPase